ncbi:MAG: DUF3316 domain-containing protein [Parabacteroides sp.]
MNRMSRRFNLCWIVVLCFVASLSAQTEPLPRSTNSATLVGVGGYNVMDTYLSPGAPERNYTGVGFSVLHERMQMTRLADQRISRQQLFRGELARTENAAATATDLVGFATYSLGYHYHFTTPLPDLQLLAGAMAQGWLGFIYNTRNGNNPASTKADADLRLSAMVFYTLRIKGYPIRLRYQGAIPFAGVCFSPHYNQSYYEIFDLGNHAGVVKFNSFHNKWAYQQLLTADFPLGALTLRVGFLGNYYRTDLNAIQSHVVSRSFVIGLAVETVKVASLFRKGATVPSRSAYY